MTFIDRLTQYNAWRRGETDDPQTNSTQFGKDIDEAIARIAELETARDRYRKDVAELVEAVEDRGDDDWIYARYLEEREGIVRCGHCGSLPDDDHADKCVYRIAAKLKELKQ